MQTFQLYIGSDNKTKRLQTGKIKRILNARHSGYTLVPVTGYWNGDSEHSVMVIIHDNTNKVLQTIEILKSALEQEAIGYQIVPNMQFA